MQERVRRVREEGGAQAVPALGRRNGRRLQQNVRGGRIQAVGCAGTASGGRSVGPCGAGGCLSIFLPRRPNVSLSYMPSLPWASVLHRFIAVGIVCSAAEAATAVPRPALPARKGP